MEPGGKEERELGWLGWSELRDISRDGNKIFLKRRATAAVRIIQASV